MDTWLYLHVRWVWHVHVDCMWSDRCGKMWSFALKWHPMARMSRYLSMCDHETKLTQTTARRLSTETDWPRSRTGRRSVLASSWVFLAGASAGWNEVACLGRHRLYNVTSCSNSNHLLSRLRRRGAFLSSRFISPDLTSSELRPLWLVAATASWL